jgi:ribosome-binding protein aMBF1 (putative translation factor)
MGMGFAAWFTAQRGRSGQKQGYLAEKVEKNQTWVSQVERGQITPSAEEAAALAYFVGGSVLEALTEGGYLDEPAWVRRLERKLDEIRKALSSR